MITDRTHDTAARAAAFIEAKLFDAQGIMYSGVDAMTGEPLARDFITPMKVPRRADIDPWAYWTYEDSIMGMGQYIDALVLEHEVTGAAAALERCASLWRVVRNVFSASQVHGIGSFLRPYGGYVQMHDFLEPLGTDQAGPLFHGLYRYLPHADALTRRRIEDVLLKTLGWYEQQGFEYFYYKFMIHSWEPGEGPVIHNASYYLPAIAWAAQRTGDAKWRDHLDERVARFTRGEQSVYDGFHWASDLPILRDILGAAFDRAFPAAVLRAGYDRAMKELAAYIEPGLTKFMCPEAKTDADFKPGLSASFDRGQSMGFAYFHTRHHGRTRPRHERCHLAALAAVGVPGAFEQAVDLLNQRHRIPEDFTAMCIEDYDRLPETVHLYARSVGIGLVGWLRDYWLLRQVEQRAT